MSEKKTLTLNRDNFEREVIEQSGPVLVDFWAEWCAPCRAVGPIVEALAEEFDGRAVVGKVDIESEPALAKRFDVRSIPTLLVLRNGEVVDRIVGVVPKKRLADALEARAS